MRDEQIPPFELERPANGELFRSVLVAVVGDLDHAATAVSSALTVADRIGAQLTVHRAVHPSAGVRVRRLWGRPHNRAASTDQLVAATSKQLDRLIDATDVLPPNEVIVAVGPWPASIVSQVKRSGHDLVVVSAHGGRDVVGEIRRLMRVCPCALLIVSERREPGPVVAVIDLADSAQRNQSTVRLAAAFADIDNDPLHVIATGAAATSSAAFAPNDRAVIHRESGDAVEVANRMAARLEASLVVVGSTGRLGAKQRLTGNTVERLLAARPQSVLIVDPVSTGASLGSDC